MSTTERTVNSPIADQDLGFPPNAYLGHLDGEKHTQMVIARTFSRKANGEYGNSYTLISPYVRFNPKWAEQKVSINGHDLIPYISEVDMKKYLSHYYNSVGIYLRENPDISLAFINMNGGKKLFDLVQTNVPEAKRLTVAEIAFRRERGGVARIDKPLPKFFLDNGQSIHCLIFESCVDSGGVARAIRQTAPNSTILAGVYKHGVQGQIPTHDVLAAVHIDNKWYVGLGADAGDAANLHFGYNPKDHRNYMGIAVVPDF